jgi:hypothetical protein
VIWGDRCVLFTCAGSTTSAFKKPATFSHFQYLINLKDGSPLFKPIKAMLHIEIDADYRVQELLTALNEGILDLDFVRTKLTEFAGDHVELIHYSNGEYGIVYP